MGIGIIFALNGVDWNADWTKIYIDTSECFVTKWIFRAFSFKCINWFDINHSRSRFVLGFNFGHFIRDCVGKFTAKMYNFKPKTNLHLEWFISNQFIHLKEKALKFCLITKHSLVSMQIFVQLALQLTTFYAKIIPSQGYAGYLSLACNVFVMAK